MKTLGQRYLHTTAAVRGKAGRFIDKLPFNFFYIGLIKQALPNAKIIWCNGNPMDTCIGNFRQLFSINSPYYAYAYDLLNIGRFLRRVLPSWAYWQAKKTDNFLLLNYEH